MTEKNENSILNRIKVFLQKNKLASAALIFLISEIIFFYPVFLRGEVIAPDVHLKFSPFTNFVSSEYDFSSGMDSDQLDYHYPKLNLFMDDISEGEYSGYEYNSKFGMPRETILNYYFPLNYLATILPIDIAMTMIIITKLFIGGIGMYLLLKELGIKHAASIFGGIVFMYSGFNIVWLWNYAATVSLLAPLFLLSISKILRGRFGYSLLSIYSVMFMILSGFVAGAIYIISFGALFTVANFVKQFLDKRPKVTFKKLINFTKPYFVTLISVITGISFTLFTLIPTLKIFDFIDLSYRMGNATNHLSMFKDLPRLFLPYLNGGVLVGRYFGSTNYNETSGYIGLIALLFAILGSIIAIKYRRKSMILFLCILIGSIMVVYGIGPSLWMLSKIPGFNNSSNTRLLMIIALTGSILASYGFNFVLTLDKKFFDRKRVLLIITTFTTLIIFSVALFVFKNLEAATSIFTNFSPQTFEQYKIDYYRIAYTMVSISLMFAGTVTLIFLTRRRKIKILVYGVIILTMLELFIYGLRQVPTIPRDLFYPKTEGLQYLIENTDYDDRIIVFEGALGLRGTEMFYDLNTPLDHELYSTKERKVIKELFIDEEQIWATPTSPRVQVDNIRYSSELMDELNIKYLVFPHNVEFDEITLVQLDLFFEEVFNKEGDLIIWQNELNHSLTHFTEKDTQQIQLFVEDAGGGHTEILDYGNLASPLKQSNGIQKYKIITEARDTFYITMAYYPGWNVKVDDTEAEIKLVDEIWMGVDVEKGKHTVEFYYDQPIEFKAGLLYTILGSVGIFASYGLYKIYKREDSFEIIKRFMPI